MCTLVRAGAVVREREDERRRLQRGELPEAVLGREHDAGYKCHVRRDHGVRPVPLLHGAPPHLAAADGVEHDAHRGFHRQCRRSWRINEGRRSRFWLPMGRHCRRCCKSHLLQCSGEREQQYCDAQLAGHGALNVVHLHCTVLCSACCSSLTFKLVAHRFERRAPTGNVITNRKPQVNWHSSRGLGRAHHSSLNPPNRYFWRTSASVETC